jgi:tRNA-Thr(GGU) m(6)t(6)A37 methyltransferase TsaA
MMNPLKMHSERNPRTSAGGSFKLKPIGSVKSSIIKPVDENWGSVVSEIHLDPALAPGLQGLDQFSHILVLFFMDQATFEPSRDLVRRPKGRADMPESGIFAQRAKHRPNPIGVTAVELLEIRGKVLKVKGLDAIDGSPVLDIKPYFPDFDRVDQPRVPEWVRRVMEGYFE